MAKRQWCRKYSEQDLGYLQIYCSMKGKGLYADVVNSLGSHGQYRLQNVNFLYEAISQVRDMYDSAQAKEANLVMERKDGGHTILYHIERGKVGISYDILKNMKAGKITPQVG